MREPSSRRMFLKGMGAAAVLAVPAARADAVPLPPLRSINILAGSGSFAWFTLLFPPPRVIKEYKPADYAYDDITKAAAIPNLPGQRELYVRLVNGEPLWQKFGARKRVTALLCGRSNTGDVAPAGSGSSNTITNGIGGQVQLFAAQAAIQSSLEPLVPVVCGTYNGRRMTYGRAPGSPQATYLDNPSAYPQIFDSGAVQNPWFLGNEANLTRFARAFRSAVRYSPYVRDKRSHPALEAAERAFPLVGTRFSTRLQLNPNQVKAWSSELEKLAPMASYLITTSTALKLGLLGQVIIPGFNDHPVTAFWGDAGRIADALARMLQIFLEDLASAPDPYAPARPLSDGVLITISGDTPFDPFKGKPNWASSFHANWIYVMSQGYLKPGWFGDVKPTGTVPFNPASGLNETSGLSVETYTDGALAATLYAVSQGDLRRVQSEFYNGDFRGLIQTQPT